MGASHGYQRGHQRQTWNAKAAAAATKKPVCKHRSLSTPPLPGASAARHCQGRMILGPLPQENTQRSSGCCNITPASATCRLALHSVTLSPPGLSEPEPPNQPLIQPHPLWMGTDVWGWLTRRGRAKSKAEPQKMCEQRREREISPSSLRSSGLNLHTQLDVPCICRIPE